MVEATVSASFPEERQFEETVASSCWQGPLYFSVFGKALP